MKIKLIPFLFILLLAACSKEKEELQEEINYYKLLEGEWKCRWRDTGKLTIIFTADSLFDYSGDGINRYENYSIKNFRYDAENTRYIGDEFKTTTSRISNHPNNYAIELYSDCLHIMSYSGTGNPYKRKKEE